MKFLKLIDRHFEDAAAALLLLVMVSISFVNVVSRYFANLSLAFTEELTVYLFVWMTILGTAIAFKTGTNMMVVFFNGLLPKGVRKVVFILSTALSLIFFASLAYLGCMEVRDEIMLGAMTESIYMPLWYFTVSIPVGSCLVMVRIIGHAVRTLRDGSY
ncbi:MAG: TRAP transporter small permease [Synergistaceae bacterium]|jgi:TRAP-type C4-dicarboxylate transport system permease small subunit|nr:TRAP transporter small permease [Synergistaceae bacterium]